MLKAMFAAALLAALFGASRGEEGPAQPKSPAPSKAVVSIDGEGILQVEQTVTRKVAGVHGVWVYDKVPGTKNTFGPRIEFQVGSGEETATTTRQVDAKALAAFDKRGRKIDPKALANLLANRTEVLISADGNAVDPSYLTDVAEGTVILILPPPEVLPPVTRDEEDPIAQQAIEALGGIVLRDEDLPVIPLIGANLQNAKLTDAQLTAGLKELAAFKCLRILNLGGTKVTDAGLKELARFKNLQHLALGGTGVTDAGLKELAALKSLQSLDLGFTDVTDAGLKELAALDRLHSLNLNRTKVTDAGLKELASLKSLQSLGLAYLHVTGAGLKELAVLENLQELILADTDVTDAGLKELAPLKSLQKLDLALTKVTDAGLKEIATLTSLQVLSLVATTVTDAGVMNLVSLKNLLVLSVRATAVTEAGAAELNKTLGYCEIQR